MKRLIDSMRRNIAALQSLKRELHKDPVLWAAYCAAGNTYTLTDELTDAGWRIKPMSDTPRTDLFEITHEYGDGKSWGEFARQLERERDRYYHHYELERLDSLVWKGEAKRLELELSECRRVFKEYMELKEGAEPHGPERRFSGEHQQRLKFSK